MGLHGFSLVIIVIRVVLHGFSLVIIVISGGGGAAWLLTSYYSNVECGTAWLLTSYYSNVECGAAWLLTSY